MTCELRGMVGVGKAMLAGGGDGVDVMNDLLLLVVGHKVSQGEF